MFLNRESFPVNKIKLIYINDNSIEVEVADTSKTREKGLSDRKSLEEGKGMLFVFERPGQYDFWMKEMNFAIDIVWISEKSYIVGIEKNVLPDTFPKTFHPDQKVKYVLEIPAGYTTKHNIEIGAEVKNLL